MLARNWYESYEYELKSIVLRLTVQGEQFIGRVLTLFINFIRCYISVLKSNFFIYHYIKFSSNIWQLNKSKDYICSICETVRWSR